MRSWLASNGGSSQLAPALFTPAEPAGSGGGGSADASRPRLRGCAAAAALPAGAAAVSLPAKHLITYATAASSDLGAALARLPGMDEETLAVIWTMVERWDGDAGAAPFWRALPARFGTGLSVPAALAELLRGTPAHAEFDRARAHVRAQCAALQQTFK